jgi:hypothetical protein
LSKNKRENFEGCFKSSSSLQTPKKHPTHLNIHITNSNTQRNSNLKSCLIKNEINFPFAENVIQKFMSLLKRSLTHDPKNSRLSFPVLSAISLWLIGCRWLIRAGIFVATEKERDFLIGSNYSAPPIMLTPIMWISPQKFPRAIRLC